jgi:hypothetical protein
MKISTILEKIDEHQLFVPAFQREYVWKRDDAKQLIDSIRGGGRCRKTHHRRKGMNFSHCQAGVDDRPRDRLKPERQQNPFALGHALERMDACLRITAYTRLTNRHHPAMTP